MPARANWKGFLKVAELTTPVALYAAASTSARIALHTVNRKTGHSLRRQYVDAETDALVPNENQVRGYEAAKDEYVMIEPDEAAEIIPQSDKTIDVVAFIDRGEIDELYFDRPYYLASAETGARETFALLREGLRSAKVVAVARAVLFRRLRTLIIRPYGAGLAATTLKFNYEVLSANDAFGSIPAAKIAGEALALAKHIIDTKKSAFDPAGFHDRYEAALGDLVKAKIDGKPIPVVRRPEPTARRDLLSALRESAAETGKGATALAKPMPRGGRRARAKPPARRNAS